MAISKANWRALESLPEPGPSSTWVFLGRSTPRVLLANTTLIAFAFSPGCDITYTPPSDPQIAFQASGGYSVDLGSGPVSTLAWDGVVTSFGADFRFVVQAWVDDAGTWLCMTERHNATNSIFLGRSPLFQRDGRMETFHVRWWGSGNGSGAGLTGSPSAFTADAGLGIQVPQWGLWQGQWDFLAGTGVTSLVLTWPN